MGTYKDPEYPKKYREAHKEYFKEKGRTWRESNPGYSSENMKKWRATSPKAAASLIKFGPEYQAARHLMKKYGLTKEAWENIFESQGRVCYLCGTDTPGGKGLWQTDHSHDNGKVRSILCWPCNVGLGWFKDNSAVLRKAADYVEYHA